MAAAERQRTLGALLLAFVLYPSFALLDWVIYPDQARDILIIRFSVSGVLLAMLPLVLKSRSFPVLLFVGAAGVSAAGIGIAWMTHITEGVESPYYAGMCLTFVFAAVWFTWPLSVALGVCSVVLLAYYLPILGYDRPVDGRMLLNNSFFLVSTLLVALVAMTMRNRLARQEYDARQRLSASIEELEAAQRAKEQMFQNVSHELRTPLTLILAPVETMLEDGNLTEPLQRRVEGMRRNGLRLLQLINDVLDLARLGSTGLELSTEPVRVSKLLSRLADDVRPMASARHVELLLETPDVALSWKLDPRHLERVILNLLSNALKFTERDGRITLRGQVADTGELLISVQDTGVGIPKEALERIFERFQQVDGGTTRRYGGTGIGLTLVQELTERMGGTVEVESTPGEGSTFRLRFPASQRLADGAARSLPPPRQGDEPLGLVALNKKAALASLPSAQRTEGAARAGSHGPRLLLAEDDPDLNAELLDLLSPHFRVTAVHDGEAALERAVDDPPDIILSDVMMPRRDGLSLTAALRERPEFRDVPIVLLTARGELEDRIKGRELGVDTYLTKPFHPREVLATLLGLLRARMRLLGSYLTKGELGSGGQSRVFLAEHIATGEPAAVKVIVQSGTMDKDAKRRAAIEQESLQRLRHPNVVRVLEQGADEERFFIAMEYLPGETVRDVLVRLGPLPQGIVRAVGVGTSRALEAVHRASLVHRDVKAANLILVDGPEPIQDRLRLIDFGTVLEEPMVAKERGLIVGTVPYMAPEVLIGERPTAASDIYSLGVTLYYLLTGKLPYHGTPDEVYRAITLASLPRVREHRPDVHPGLEGVVLTAMARLAEERFATAAEMEQALLALDGLGSEELEPPADTIETVTSAATSADG